VGRSGKYRLIQRRADISGREAKGGGVRRGRGDERAASSNRNVGPEGAEDRSAVWGESSGRAADRGAHITSLGPAGRACFKVKKQGGEVKGGGGSRGGPNRRGSSPKDKRATVGKAFMKKGPHEQGGIVRVKHGLSTRRRRTCGDRGKSSWGKVPKRLREIEKIVLIPQARRHKMRRKSIKESR